MLICVTEVFERVERMDKFKENPTQAHRGKTIEAKRKPFKRPEEKSHVLFRGAIDFQQKEWNLWKYMFKVLEENACQPRVLHPVKILFEREAK